MRTGTLHFHTTRSIRHAQDRSAISAVVAKLAAALITAAIVLAPLPSLSAERLDVNTANVEQLTRLPGIGPAKAAAIVDERSRRPFSSVADLERVKGIGPGLIADLRGLVTVAEDAGK